MTSKEKKIKNWYKLDNVAKIFPPTKDKKDTRKFRFSVGLKENVDSEVLKEALDITLKEFPTFSSVIKRGLFWYYLEESDIEARPILESTPICDYRDINDLVFKVFFYKKRISLEVNHELTDGTGALLFLRNLTAKYLQIKHKIKKPLIINDSSIEEKNDDSFAKYSKNNYDLKPTYKEKAYHIKKEEYSLNRLRVIEGLMSCSKVLEQAKKYNTTLTVYIASLYIKSICMTMSERERKKRIYIMIPVNLRKYFDSSTTKNFFNTVNVSYKCNKSSSLKDIIASIDKQLKDNLTKEALSKNMNTLLLFEELFIVRLIPIFIKDIILKIAHLISKRTCTSVFSNVGIVTMPECLDKYIEYFDFFTSTSGIQLCACSYKDNLMLSFTSHFKNSEIEKNLFRMLSKEGVDITINSNIIKEDTLNEDLL